MFQDSQVCLPLPTWQESSDVEAHIGFSFRRSVIGDTASPHAAAIGGAAPGAKQGPVLPSTRPGRFEKLFLLLKCRTMAADPNELEAKNTHTPDATQLTFVGPFGWT